MRTLLAALAIALCSGCTESRYEVTHFTPREVGGNVLVLYERNWRDVSFAQIDAIKKAGWQLVTTIPANPDDVFVFERVHPLDAPTH